MHGISNSYAEFVAWKLIRRARLTLRLSCDRRARTTARAAKQLWLSADLSLALIHCQRSLHLQWQRDAQARQEFYAALRQMPSWGSVEPQRNALGLTLEDYRTP